MNWPQPRCPLHAPKLLWSRLTKANVGHNPEQSRPKWDGTGLSVLFEKRMLHLWLVALCVHVVMWSSICPSSHRYHGNSATHVSLYCQWTWTSRFQFFWASDYVSVVLMMVFLLLWVLSTSYLISPDLSLAVTKISLAFFCIHETHKLSSTCVYTVVAISRCTFLQVKIFYYNFTPFRNSKEVMSAMFT